MQVQPHRLEELAGVRQLGPVCGVCVAYLVVADFERHRAPGLPEVVQLDVIRLHDVLLGNPIGRGRVPFYHAAGEPLPTGAEPRVELGGVGCGIGRRGGVQVRGEPRVLLAEAHLERAATLDDPVGEHARHDRVRHHGAHPHEVLGRAPAEPAYRVVEMAHAVGPLHRAISSLIRSSSSLVM